jgi:hypothetical protein
LKKNYTGPYYAPSFVDNIDVQTVCGTVKGNAKKNQIKTAWMDGGTYQGGGGDDIIIAKKGSKNYIYGDDESGTSKGNDTITVQGGDGHHVYGQYGDDIISVSGGAKHDISGGDGKDTISVTSGHSHKIDGSYGNDTITLNYVKGNGNQTSYVLGGDGTDTIVVKNSSDVYVGAENGIGHYTIENSSNVTVQSYGDYGTFDVKSCTDTRVRLSSTSGNNVNTVTVKGGANNVTIEQYPCAIDYIKVNWCDGFGKLTIETSSLGDLSNKKYADTLYIDKAMIDFNFNKKGYDLQIEGKFGGEIYIKGYYFNSGSPLRSFVNGINFSNGGVYK